MDEEAKRNLEEVIKSDIYEISQMDVGSEERSKAIEDLTKLHNIKTEEMEEPKKRWFQDVDFMSMILRYGVEVGLKVSELIFLAAWMKRGFTFEETGSFTSNTFKWLMNLFKPSKRM